MKLGFIGTGHMGGALARAASQNSSNTLLLANRHPEKAQKLAEIIGGNPCDNLQAASEADYLFLLQHFELLRSRIQQHCSLER